MLSPTPMAWIGRPKRSASATSTPPLAVPSSLVITRPVTSAILRKISTWESAFCPVVASSTSSVLCGASGSRLRITRTILASSAIRSSRFCSRPAVSMSRRSAPSASARAMASKARLAGSEPCGGGHHRHAGALAPDLQLLDGGGAEGVAGGDHHLLAGGAELAGELADGGGLARAVDADDQHHLRAAGVDRHRPGDRLEDGGDLAGEQVLDLARADPAAEAALGDGGGDLERGLDPHVGGDQQLLEALEHGVVEHPPLLGLKQPADQARPRRGLGRARAGRGRGASSRMASSPSSIFEEDLNSRSLSFWKNAMPASPLRALT